MTKRSDPPKLLLRFFRWFCHPDLAKYVEGDLVELFHLNQKSNGNGKANWLFALEVLRLLRRSLFRKFEGNYKLNYYGMVKHDLLMSFRQLGRGGFHSILNPLGLSLGIASFILIFQFVQFEKSYDQFHINSENLYRVNYEYLTTSGIQGSTAVAPPRVVQFMKEEIPEVKSFTRIHPGELSIAFGEVKYNESNVLFVDQNFLEFFSFPLIQGDMNSCLDDENSIIMSESTAKKYFGTANPIGRVVTIIDDETEYFTVTGVVKDVPINSQIQFDVLLTFKKLNSWYGGGWEGEDGWYRLGFHGFISLEPEIDVDTLQTKFKKVFDQERGESNGDFTQKFNLQPISELHYANNLRFELNPEEQADKETLQFLLIIGYLILVIAWINYVNLSTARAINRAREVGVRKTLGARRKQLIAQFILESLVMNFIAGILALFIVFSCSSYFYELAGAGLTSNNLWGLSIFKLTVTVWLLGSFFGGLYPAFALSSFKPSTALKNISSTMGSRGLLRKTLVICQFIASIALITGTLIFHKQLSYMKNKDIGIDTNNVMVIKGPDVDHGRIFSEVLLTHPAVISTSISSSLPGEIFRGTIFANLQNAPADKEIFANWSGVDYNYFTTLGIEVLAGRTFDPSFGSDSLGYIINEEAARLLGFDTLSHIIGETLTLSDNHPPHKVIGVVENINHLSSKYAVKPLIMALDDWPVYYVVKYKNDCKSVMQSAENLFDNLYPEYAFDVFFLDEFYNRQYRDEDQLSNMITVFSGLAIFIACLGLFGLASHNTLKRTKEIGIRKVLGASITSLLMLLSKEFVSLVVAANIVTWPVVYYFMEEWLSNFAFRISIEPPVFLFSALIALLLAFLTVNSITMKVARANPTDALRNE